MKFKLFSVYDTKSKLYSHPAFFKTHGEAMRAFMEACKNKESTLGKYPEDFVFFMLGEFDEETGLISQHLEKDDFELFKSVARGIDFKE